MNRYCTFTTWEDCTPRILAQGHEEAQLPDDIADWVWQFAESPEQAIAQHHDKVDEWHFNPYKDTY